MSIKVKNSQLDNETVQAINNLIELEMNASVAFRLSKIIKELSSIVDDKVKMEQKILDKWAEKDEFGNTVLAKGKDGNILPGSVSLRDPESFTNEMNALMEIENQIPFDRINFDDLNLKTAKVKDLMKLEFLFN